MKTMSNTVQTVRAISKWQKVISFERCFPKHLLVHALKCFSSTGEKAAELFAGFIHFATGLTEGSFLHHGVRKRWNITASEVQFLGTTAVAKVKFLGAVTTKLQLLEPS